MAGGKLPLNEKSSRTNIQASNLLYPSGLYVVKEVFSKVEDDTEVRGRGVELELSQLINCSLNFINWQKRKRTAGSDKVSKLFVSSIVYLHTLSLNTPPQGLSEMK